MDSASNPLPPRTFNRWTLEPLAFLLPFLSVALTLVALAHAAPAGGDTINSTLVIVLMIFLGVLTLASLRHRR